MAGMLPGVECARRRRIHQSGGGCSSASDGLTPTSSSMSMSMSRRSSFCLYTSKHESHHTSCISSLRSIINQACQDEKLAGIAREAKERLDERLRTKRKSSDSKSRQNGKESSIMMNINKSTVLHTQVFGSKKSDSKRFSWSKLSWKACEQEECAICLERFKVGDTLVHLPCAHRFHARCLLPWLDTNAHNCPCCRMQILHPGASAAN